MRLQKESFMLKGSHCAAAVVLLMGGGLAKQGTEKDPHRPACTDAQCRKIESFMKAHFCGESPYGNGPDDGCLIKFPKAPGAGAHVLAQYNCEWNDDKQVQQCSQHGQSSPMVRKTLVHEMRRLGLPPRAAPQIYFTVWKSISSDWSMAEAFYSHTAGSSLELCQVIAVIDRNSRVVVLRQVPFQKTDVDVPRVTLWSPVEFADADGSGEADIILEGDAYEDHWLEVISVRGGNARTLFSGLGYYL